VSEKKGGGNAKRVSFQKVWCGECGKCGEIEIQRRTYDFLNTKAINPTSYFTSPGAEEEINCKKPSLIGTA